MTLKSYLWGLRISAIISLLGFGLIVYSVDPQKSGILGQFLFYLSLFFFLSGVFILFFTRIRKASIEEETSLAYLGLSFRQGILLALLAIVLLAMQSFRVLTWWDGLLATAAVFLAELYFLSE